MDYYSTRFKELIKAKKSAMYKLNIAKKSEVSTIISEIYELEEAIVELNAAEEFYNKLLNKIFVSDDFHITMASIEANFYCTVKHYFYPEDHKESDVADAFVKIVNTSELIAFNKENVEPKDIIYPSESLTIYSIVE